MTLRRLLALSLFVMPLGVEAVPAHAEVIRVTVENLEFLPAEVTAKVGDTVEWVNKDMYGHTATVKQGWDVDIPAHATAMLVMTEAGAVTYYCRFHPNMTGRIVVTAK